MASGKITVINNTSNTFPFNITENGQPAGTPVASGSVESNQQTDLIVSGYDLYEVIILAPSSGIFEGPIVTPDSQVEFIVSSDPD